jgi:hypothetical protein
MQPAGGRVTRILFHVRGRALPKATAMSCRIGTGIPFENRESSAMPSVFPSKSKMRAVNVTDIGSRKGRNLLFLRQTVDPGVFEIAEESARNKIAAAGITQADATGK